jgi:hypothetical protein
LLTRTTGQSARIRGAIDARVARFEDSRAEVGEFADGRHPAPDALPPEWPLAGHLELNARQGADPAKPVRPSGLKRERRVRAVPRTAQSPNDALAGLASPMFASAAHSFGGNAFTDSIEGPFGRR